MECIGVFHFGLLRILSEDDKKQPRTKKQFFFSFFGNLLPEEVFDVKNQGFLYHTQMG